jgi:hypothetical protein
MFYSQNMLFSTLKLGTCGVDRSGSTPYILFYRNIWPTIQLIIIYLIPTCLMIMSLIGIQVKMHGQQNLVAAPTRREKLQRQMLILMISSVACFSLCTLPYSILRAIIVRFGPSSTTAIPDSVTTILLTMNYSCNFYIHCLTSRLFRETFIKQLKQLFKLCKIPANDRVYPIAAITGTHAVHPTNAWTKQFL